MQIEKQAETTRIFLARESDAPDVLSLRREFLREGAENDDAALPDKNYFAPGRGAILIAQGENGECRGFIEVSIRQDYVNGCSSSGVGFVELLYVRPQFRHQGLGGKLVREAEHWANAHGCQEFAVDTFLDDTTAQGLYKHLGFVEAERVVYFTKRLP